MLLLRRTLLALALAGTVGLGACGGDDGDDEPTAASTTTATTDAAGTSGDVGTDDPTTTLAASTTSTTAAEGSSTTTPADEDLPGEAIDIYPYEGASLAVVGVDADDTLNVRSGPGTDVEVVVELDPLADGFTATGRNRTLDDGSSWAELTVDDATGWANGAYLAQLGAPSEVSDQVAPPVEETDTESAALAVARLLHPSEEGPAATVTVVARASTTDVTVDVIGLGDDAQKGSRLHVTGVGPGLAVTSTPLCARGVSDGLCV